MHNNDLLDNAEMVGLQVDWNDGSLAANDKDIFYFVFLVNNDTRLGNGIFASVDTFGEVNGRERSCDFKSFF